MLDQLDSVYGAGPVMVQNLIYVSFVEHLDPVSAVWPLLGPHLLAAGLEMWSGTGMGPERWGPASR